MGLTNKLNECIEEVDVIIAGGMSDLFCFLYLKGDVLTITNCRRNCRVCTGWETGRS